MVHPAIKDFTMIISFLREYLLDDISQMRLPKKNKMGTNMIQEANWKKTRDVSVQFSFKKLLGQ